MEDVGNVTCWIAPGWNLFEMENLLLGKNIKTGNILQISLAWRNDYSALSDSERIKKIILEFSGGKLAPDSHFEEVTSEITVCSELNDQIFLCRYRDKEVVVARLDLRGKTPLSESEYIEVIRMVSSVEVEAVH